MLKGGDYKSWSSCKASASAAGPRNKRENGEGCSDLWQADTLARCAKEDRRCTKGAMGTGEDGKKTA
jgi:hypothetical protein